MWYWCLHCERAQWQKLGPEKCKFDGCDGGPLDLLGYRKVRKDYHEIAKRWPEIPEEEKVYPLYA